MCLVAWPLNGSEAGVDFVLIESSRGFNPFWHECVVRYNSVVLFWKAFLSREVQGHAPEKC